MPTLEITTTLGCTLACRFCPQGRLVKSYPRYAARSLALAQFVSVLEKLPRHVRVDFAGMAEPWLNPQATAMVARTFEAGRKVAIYTTLQGMQPDDAGMLIARYVDRISPEMPWVIHLPDAEGNMAGWKPSPAYFATLAQFVALQRHGAPAGFSFMTMSADGAVATPLQPLFQAALPHFQAISRVENLDRQDFAPGELLRAVQHAGALLCGSTPFFDHNTMLPNGDVVLCCMDYGRQHILGNLLQQSYAELFTGAAANAVRARAMGIDEGPLICRACHNAVCLDQQDGAHWRPRHEAVWTMPARPPQPVLATRPVRRSRLRRWMHRALAL